MTERGTRLTLTDLPEEWIDFCVKTRPDLKPYDTWEEFKDYWTALPGPNATKLDWAATWRNWVRRSNHKPVFAQEQPVKRVFQPSRPLPPRQRDSAAYREFQARLQAFRASAKTSQHPRFISYSWVHVGQALAAAHDEAERERLEERIAIQQEGNISS